MYVRHSEQHRRRKSELNLLMSAMANGVPLRAEVLNGSRGNIVLLHWVNMQIMNYRSILRVGKVQMPLWEVSASDGTQSFLYASPIGATAASSGEAVLHIELDSYAHPVAYPNSDVGWGVADGRNDE